MKAFVGAFNQEKALVGAFSVIVQPVVEPMDRFAALMICDNKSSWDNVFIAPNCYSYSTSLTRHRIAIRHRIISPLLLLFLIIPIHSASTHHSPHSTTKIRRWCMLCKELGISSVHGCLPDWQWSESTGQPPTFPTQCTLLKLEIYLLIDWHGTSVIEYWGCGNGILMFSLNPLFRICRECKVSYFQI